MRSGENTPIFLRITALIVLLSFNSTLIQTPSVYAQNPGGVEVHDPHSLKAKLPSLAALNLPRELGTIEASETLDPARTVLLIQDAHAVGEAQKSIRKITEYLSSQYGVNLFALEGASGKLDTTFLKNFPDSKKLAEVFGNYLQAGEISGAAAGAVLNPGQANYYGIEDQKLYEEGITLFLQALEEMPQWHSEIETLQKQIKSEKQKIYSPELLEVDAKIQDLDSQEHIAEALQFFAAKQIKEKIDLSGLPHVAAIFKQLNPETQNAKTKAALLKFTETLRRKISRASELTEINRQTQDYLTERHSSNDYAAFLVKKAKAYTVEIPESIQAWGETSEFLSQIRGRVLFDELHDFTQELKKHFYKTDAARELDALQERTVLLKNLSELKLSRKEWEILKGQGEKPSVIARKAQPDEAISEIASLVALARNDVENSSFIRFYKNAEAREKALHENLLNLAKTQNSKITAVVAGGFHASGMIDLLKKENISYALIAPAIPALEKDSRYQDYMKGNVSWKNYFKIENGQVNLYGAFSRATRDRLVKPNDPALKTWRDQILRNLANENNLLKAKDYTIFIDEIAKNLKSGSEERFKKEWLGKVEGFIQGLEKLQNENQYDAAHLSQLLGKTSNITQGTAVYPLVNTQVSAVLAGDLSGTRRSETRLLESGDTAALNSQTDEIVAAARRFLETQEEVIVEFQDGKIPKRAASREKGKVQFISSNLEGKPAGILLRGHSLPFLIENIQRITPANATRSESRVPELSGVDILIVLTTLWLAGWNIHDTEVRIKALVQAKLGQDKYSVPVEIKTPEHFGKRSETRTLVAPALNEKATSVSARADIDRAFNLKEAQKARANWVYQANREILRHYGNYSAAKKIKSEAAQEKELQAIRKFASGLETLAKQIVPDPDSPYFEAETAHFKKIDEMSYEDLREELVTLSNQLVKDLKPKLQEAYKRQDNDTLKELNIQAVEIYKARIKIQIKRILERLSTPTSNGNSVIIQMTALSEAYLKLAYEYTWRYRRAVAEVDTAKLNLLGRYSKVSQTYDYSAFRIFESETTAPQEKPKVTLVRNYWEREDVGSDQITYRLVPKEVQYDGLDGALQGGIEILLSEEKDYAQILFHINTLKDAVELLTDYGSNIPPAQWQQVQMNLSELVGQNGALSMTRARVPQKRNAGQDVRSAVILLSKFPSGDSQETEKRIKQAIEFLTLADKQLEERKTDVERISTGIAKQVDYVIHQIRRELTYQAAQMLESDLVPPQKVRKGLLPDKKYKEAADLLEELYAAQYTTIVSDVSSVAGPYKNLQASLSRLIQKTKALASLKTGAIETAAETRLLTGIRMDLELIKSKTRSSGKRSEMRIDGTQIVQKGTVIPILANMDLKVTEIRRSRNQQVGFQIVLNGEKINIPNLRAGESSRVYLEGNGIKVNGDQSEKNPLFVLTTLSIALNPQDANLDSAQIKIDLDPVQKMLNHWRAVEGVEILRGGKPGIEDSRIEHLGITDENGVSNGEGRERGEVHGKGLWHEVVFAVFFYKGKVLLKLRSMKKSSSPGKLEIGASGHLGAGETQIKGVVREAYEEAGVKMKPEKILPILKPKAIKHSTVIEEGQNNEFLTFFFYPLDDKEIRTIQENYNTGESDEVWLVPTEVFEKMLKENPELFSAGANAFFNESSIIYQTAKQLAKQTDGARSEIRLESPKDYKNQDVLISDLVKEWKTIQQEGFVAFDMQKTLTARKKIASAEIITQLAWFLDQGIRVMINSGNTKKEVFDQVVAGLRLQLEKDGKNELLNKVTIYANSGTLKVTFDKKGAEVEHPEYQQDLKLPKELAPTLAEALKELAKQNFFIKSESAMKKLRGMYEKDAQKTQGRISYQLWDKDKPFEPSIVDFETMQGQISGPHVQRRGITADDFPTAIALTKFHPDTRPQIIAFLKKWIEEKLGAEILKSLNIGSGGESTIDIISVNANKALALVDYIKTQPAESPLDPAFGFFVGDELTLMVHGETAGNEGDHAGNDSIVMNRDPRLKGFRGIAVTPETPFWTDPEIAARIYFVGGEQEGTEKFLKALRAAIEAKEFEKKLLQLQIEILEFIKEGGIAVKITPGTEYPVAYYQQHYGGTPQEIARFIAGAVVHNISAMNMHDRISSLVRETAEGKVLEVLLSKASKTSRSELRETIKDRADEPLLFGVHELNPDWWIMRVIGSVMLEIRRKQNTEEPVAFASIYRGVRSKLVGHGFKEEKTLSADHIKTLLKRMRTEFQLVTQVNDRYNLAADSHYFAIKVHDVYYIHAEIQTALDEYTKAPPSSVQRRIADEQLLSVLNAYASASEIWQKYPVEARWPVLKAVSLLTQEQNVAVGEFLKKHDALLKRPLLDSVSQMAAGKSPEGWLRKNAQNLVGSIVFYISPETWRAAGGLGRVGQYHTVKAKELMGQDADLVTIEPGYSTYDPNAPEAEKFKMIDYSKVPVPVHNLTKVEEMSFKVRATRRGQRTDVWVDVYRGINEFGIEVYLLKDRPAEGKAHGYFVNELYKYEDSRKPLPYESATWEEFTEFFGIAALKLSKRIKFQKQQEKGRQEIQSVLWTNDGQSAALPVLKRMSDQLEKLTAEQKKQIQENPNLKWKDLFGGDEETLLSEYKDLLQEDHEASMLLADTNQTTHTYRNRGFVSFSTAVLNTVVYVWRRYFRSLIYENTGDYTRGGIGASDGANGVAAIHAQEMNQHDPESVVVGITNGDDREASRGFFVSLMNKIFKPEPAQTVQLPASGEVPKIKAGEGSEPVKAEPKNPDYLTAEEILQIKTEGKKEAAVDPDFLKLDPEFANLRSDRPILSYSGRGVDEKLDHTKVFNRYNIEQLVAQGAQIILFANVQADPEGKSQKMFDDLKEIQRQVNALEATKKAGGRLIVATGWGIPEQRKLFAISDAGVYVSARDKDWGTEAAGFTEADYALNGGIVITSTYLEAIFQQQGFMIDWNKPGLGNTVIPEGDGSKNYLEAMSRVVQEWKKNPAQFAQYQAASIRYSRSLDARFTAAQYLRHFDRLRSRRSNPREVLQRFLQGDREGVFFRNEWFRADLLAQLLKHIGIGLSEFEYAKEGTNPNIRAFAVEMQGRYNIVLLRQGRRYPDESSYTHLINGEGGALETILNVQGIPRENTRVRVVNAIDGREYKTISVKQLLEEGIPVDIPEDFQVLQIEEVEPETEIDVKVSRTELFQERKSSPAIRNAMLELIPEGLRTHLSAEGYDSEQIDWHILGRTVAEHETHRGKPIHMMAEKGNGNLILTMTPSTEGLTDLRSKVKSVFEGIGEGAKHFRAFAHIGLEAQGDILFITAGKINLPLEDKSEHAVFKKWFRENLLPWAQEFDFKTIRIEQTQLSDEALLSLHFERLEAGEKIWEYTVPQKKGALEEDRTSFVSDASAKKFLDAAIDPFIWKSSHEANLLLEYHSGILGWLSDYTQLENEGKLDLALEFHSANASGSSAGDVFAYLEGAFKPIRGLEALKQEIDQLKREAAEASEVSVKIQKAKEAVAVIRRFIGGLSWKVYRDLISNKTYAQQIWQNPTISPILQDYLSQHLKMLVESGKMTLLQSTEEMDLYSILMNQIQSYNGGRIEGKRVLIGFQKKANGGSISLLPEQVRQLLTTEPEKTPRGYLKASDLREHNRLGVGFGRRSQIFEASIAEANGFSIISPSTPGFFEIVFESGEADRLLDTLKEAVTGDPEAVKKLRQEIQYHIDQKDITLVLKKIVEMGKEKMLETVGAENLSVAMALIANLEPRLLEGMKEWDKNTYGELHKVFSNKRDRDVFHKGVIAFDESSLPSSLIFSRSFEGRKIFTPLLLSPVLDAAQHEKITFRMTTTAPISLEAGKNYQVRNKVTSHLYWKLHNLETIEAAGGWGIRLSNRTRYQILEFEPEEIKAPNAKQKFENLMIAVNISDLGIELQTGGKTIATVKSLAKLKEILPFLAEHGAGQIYVYGGVFKMGGLSKKIHVVHNTRRHFESSDDGKVTVAIQDYDVKSLTYTGDQGEDIKVEDNGGNPFSLLREKKTGVPLLNPDIFVPNEKSNESEQQEDYRREFKEFNEYASGLGLEMFYDHIFWYAPEDVDETNYKDFFYRDLSQADQAKFNEIEEQRKAFQTEVTAMLNSFEVVKGKSFIAEKISQGAFAIAKQNLIDSVVEANGGFFAVRIMEEGKERVVLVHHLNGGNLDQALPNPFSPNIRQQQLNYIKFLIDHGASGVRSDLAGKLLSYGNVGWLGGHFSNPTMQYTSPFDVDDEFWKWLIPKAKRYAREQRPNYNPAYDGFAFAMEAYGDEERKYLSEAGADLLYYKDLMEAYHSVAKGASPEELNKNLETAFRHYVNEWHKLLAFTSNFDERSMEAIGHVKAVLLQIIVMAASGVPTMIDLRDLTDVGTLRTIPGGKDRATQEIGHTISTPEQAVKRDKWSKYKAAIENGSGFKLLDEVVQVTKVKGQRYFKTILTPDHHVSGLSIQEPETGSWTIALGHYRLGPEGTQEMEIQLPDEMFYDGQRQLGPGDLKLTDVESKTELSINDRKVKIIFGPGAQNSGKLLRLSRRSEARTVSSLSRSESREAVIRPILTGIAAGIEVPTEAVQTFGALPLPEAISQIRTMAKEPVFIEAYTQTRSGNFAKQFRAQHPDYDREVSAVIQNLANQARSEAEKQAATNPSSKLYYEFVLSMKDLNARENVLTYLKGIAAAKSENSNVKTNILLLRDKTQIENPEWKAFFKEVEHLGVAKFMNTDDSKFRELMTQFLEENPRALIYGMTRAAMDLRTEILSRVVEFADSVDLNTALPVIAQETNGLAKIGTRLKAAEIKALEIVPRTVMAWGASGPTITQAAFGFIYQSYLAIAASA